MQAYKVLLVLAGGVIPLNEAFNTPEFSTYVAITRRPQELGTITASYHNVAKEGTKRNLLSDAEQVIRSRNFQSRGWHRRLSHQQSSRSLYHVPHSEKKHQLKMKSSQRADNLALIDTISSDYRYGDANFILENYESSSPSILFSDTNKDLNIDMEMDMNLDAYTHAPPPPAVLSKPAAKDKTKIKKGSRRKKIKLKKEKRRKHKKIVKQTMKQPRDSKFRAAGHAFVARITRSRIENFLQGFISRHLVETPDDLTIQCLPKGNIIARLFRGYLRCDARADFRRLVFSGIRLSSGSLEARRMGLNILAFWRRQRRQRKRQRQRQRRGGSSSADSNIPRYKNQFDFHVDNCVFTRDDLFRSTCIRNGLQRLLVRILKNKGIEPSVCTVKVTSIDILSNGKVACIGEANTIFGTTLPFEVRSAINFTTRGHVVSFPGLEVSFGASALGLIDFPIKVPTVDLDIGHNAKLRKVEINGIKKTLTISASATITPFHTIKLSSYRQSSSSYSAPFSVDVGRWLTKLGNFAT